jgi:hypothetical protein
MKLFLAFSVTISWLFTSCISKSSIAQSVMRNEDYEPNLSSKDKIISMMSLSEIKLACGRLTNFRDQLKGIEDIRTFDEIELSRSVGGYGYEELLYIVSRYGKEVGKDKTYEKCVKYLYLFNDGEYSGAIERVIPESKSKFEGKSQEWLLNK